MGVGYSQISTLGVSFYLFFLEMEKKRVLIEVFACSVHMSLFLM